MRSCVSNICERRIYTMIFGNKHVRRQTLKIWELTLCYLVIMATTMEVAVREADNAARDNGGAVAICSC